MEDKTMMKYNEIVKAIEEIRRDIKGMEHALDTEIDNHFKQFDGMSLKEKIEAKKANKEAEEKHMKKIAELQENLIDAKLNLKYMENNAKIALFNEVMPIVVSIWNKYSGKPLGVKTAEKIKAEIAKETNCSMYLSNRYGNEDIHIMELDTHFEFTCGTKYLAGNKKQMLIDNKVQSLVFEDLELYYINREYVEDINGTIEELKTLRKRAEKAQKELIEICEKFNNLAVDGIESIHYSKNIYGSII